MDNIEKARVTRAEAALLAGVSKRTISRWSAEGIIRARYTGRRAVPVDYDPDEVLRAAGRNADLAALVREPETDIST